MTMTALLYYTASLPSHPCISLERGVGEDPAQPEFQVGLYLTDLTDAWALKATARNL